MKYQLTGLGSNGFIVIELRNHKNNTTPLTLYTVGQMFRKVE